MKTVQELSEKWLQRHSDTLTHSQRHVLQSSFDRAAVSRNTNDAVEEQLSFGDRLADAVARFGGSWKFILGFSVFLLVWTVVNTVLLGRGSFDPYPFIFLNLMLSMLAAFQAPIIMMAQNRQAQHDRIDAAHDYEVNLKAEIEIMALHDKLDQLRNDELLVLLQRIEAMAESIRSLELTNHPKRDDTGA